MKYFTSIGICTLGKGRDIHASKLPQGWKEWACDNVKGFREAFEAALAANHPPEPQQRPRGTPGRKYVLHSHKRKFEP